jgi:hypothetical protein
LGLSPPVKRRRARGCAHTPAVWSFPGPRARDSNRDKQAPTPRLPRGMRIPTTAVTRRALALGACALLSPLELLPAIADAPPTYSLKGIPGLSAVTGSERPRPELGVIGKGANGDKSGILQFCDRKGCISSFTPPDEEGYVPPWTYDPQYSTRAVSAFDSRREALRAAARAEQAERQQQDDGQPQPTASVVPAKTVDSAREELRAAVEAASGQIVTSQDRYRECEPARTRLPPPAPKHSTHTVHTTASHTVQYTRSSRIR